MATLCLLYHNRVSAAARLIYVALDAPSGYAPNANARFMTIDIVMSTIVHVEIIGCSHRFRRRFIGDTPFR